METRFSMVEREQLLEVIYSNSADVTISPGIILRLVTVSSEVCLDENIPPVIRLNKVPLTLTSNSRFIAIPIGLILSKIQSRDGTLTVEDSAQHANVLVIDQCAREI
jgi:hypothetical protein